MKQKCRAVIVAAGSGRRMGGDIPKQFMELGSSPIIVHTIRKFDRASSIDDIMVIIADEYIDYMERNILGIYEFNKPITLVEGAEERQQSVYNGLKALPEDTDIVVIHDGVRPFIKVGLIEESVAVARDYGAVVVGVPVKDTIKKVCEDGYICETMNRDVLWATQTPQTFKYDLILDAHEQAIKDEFAGTDDSMLVERLGVGVNMIMGSYENIKITTKEDLYIAKAFLEDIRGVI